MAYVEIYEPFLNCFIMRSRKLYHRNESKAQRQYNNDSEDAYKWWRSLQPQDKIDLVGGNRVNNLTQAEILALYKGNKLSDL